MAGEQQGAGGHQSRGRKSQRERPSSTWATHHKGGVIAAHLRALATPRRGLVVPRGAGFRSQGPGHASRSRKSEARASLETELPAGC